MALNDDSPLDRATRALREERPAGWVELSGSIRDAVRSSVRRGIDLPADPGPDAGRSSVAVADSVLRLALRDGVNAPDRSLTGASVQLDEGRLSRLGLQIVCRYGTDLLAEADTTRRIAREIVGSTLGRADDVAIDVEVVDVDVT